MNTLNYTINCNGTEQDIISALKELMESIETYGVHNSEDAWIDARIEN